MPKQLKITRNHKRVMQFAQQQGNVNVPGLDNPRAYDPPLREAEFLCHQLVNAGYLTVVPHTVAREFRRYDVVMAFPVSKMKADA